MSLDNRVWFKSKIDWWVAAILIIAPLVQIAVLISALRNGDQEALAAGLIGIGIVAAIYALLVVPVRYGISEDDLIIRFGVVRQRIKYDSIVEIYPSHCALSSAALSLDRLAIKTGRGPLYLTLISPLEREEFIAMITRAANLSWDGRRWVRAENRTSAF